METSGVYFEQEIKACWLRQPRHRYLTTYEWGYIVSKGSVRSFPYWPFSVYLSCVINFGSISRDGACSSFAQFVSAFMQIRSLHIKYWTSAHLWQWPTWKRVDDMQWGILIENFDLMHAAPGELLWFSSVLFCDCLPAFLYPYFLLALREEK